ncbi:DHA2 family efflux MFS transporter permease subunit [Kaistia geumhonensis]|uniref:EmrB/QacA subfamily drug resistance transporter n=1 Tax=Kaistia geumhonensis TaxID=410839 RepID=A0ABU0M213_9HYPH|nr:DHA2 family efflux MFS transporter permease subunit [Kaistia geumhonensis]MCX5479781.1 DHA2 family efflux MFS transporter permease subunit [Kaistia geumhonensis]MDQ0514994.1 EmrB/QacA subfamily drug resistance transporter [Kaistia geumhonensis]
MPARLLPDRILLPLIVACALFMENLDSTVLATALPTIARDFGISPINLKLALTSYLLTIAVFIPASGWVADRFGARTVFRVAIVLFTLGSICCGLSNSIEEIVAYRILQGLGGAMMVPVGRLVILRSVQKSELVGALAWLTVPALIGPVVGPPLGGFITTYFDWRWIFWINVPIGILGLFLATLYIPDIRGEERVPFDYPGFVLSSFGIAGFVTGSTSLGLNLMPLPYVLALLLGGGGLLVAYVVYSRRLANPILDLSLFAIPSFRASVIGGLLFRIGIGAMPFLLPLMLQLGYGLTPFQSGSITFVSAIGAIAMKFVAPPLLRRFGFRSVLIANSFIAAIFIGMPAAFDIGTPLHLITALLFIGGFFRSLQFTSANALSFADVPQARMSRATSLTSVFQQLAMSIGVSVGAIALELSLAGTDGTIEVGTFHPAFIAIGLISMSSAIFFMRMPRNAGEEMAGRKLKPKPLAPDPVTAMRERA